MKLIDILKEEIASFSIDDKPGKEYFANGDKRSERRPVSRESERGNEIEWRAGIKTPNQKDPNSRNWDIVTNLGKLVKPGLKLADANLIIKNRTDLIAKYGQLKVVYHA